MGFSVSWVAFENLSEKEVLRRTGFVEAGQSTGFPSDDSPFAFAVLPTGWSAVLSNDYRFGSARGLAHLSRGAKVLGVQIEEHIMFCASALFQDERLIWRVAHDSDKGRYDLEVKGTLPSGFAAIRDRCFAEQAKEPRGRFATDYVFDIPVGLAEMLTGYRHDRWKFEWGIPRFEKLKAATPL